MGWRRYVPVPELPLLVKELSELAARRRTYILRFVYATLLFGSGLIVLFGNRASNSSSIRGLGKALFDQLVMIQQIAILLLVPSMTASALTQEKERETLPLLLLTTISPYEIVLQKFLSRVVVVLSYVMLSFPLLAVAYAYGGTSFEALRDTCIVLVVSVFYLAALSIMCSSYFRTTVEAMLAVYVIQVPISAVSYGALPSLFMQSADQIQNSCGIAVFGVISIFVSFVFLVVATELLHARAFIPPRNVLLQIFQALDRFFNDWNQVTGGVILIRDGSPLPLTDPVAWRETAKKSLGTFRYLVRVLVVIEVPILFTSQLVNISMIRGHQAMTGLLYLLWIASVAMVCLHAGNVIASERSRQTLDVLLATPISGKDLLRQKMAGVRRLLMVLAIPFATIILFEHWFRDYGWAITDDGWGLWYVCESTLTVLAVGYFITWLAFWVGLRTKSSLAAILYALGAVGAVCLVPRLIAIAAPIFTSGITTDIVTSVMAFDPATLVQMVEGRPEIRRAQRISDAAFPWMFIAAIALYFWAGRRLSRGCFENANDLLGRSWSPEDDIEAVVVSEDGGPTMRQRWGGLRSEGSDLSAAGVAVS